MAENDPLNLNPIILVQGSFGSFPLVLPTLAWPPLFKEHINERHPFRVGTDRISSSPKI